MKQFEMLPDQNDDDEVDEGSEVIDEVGGDSSSHPILRFSVQVQLPASSPPTFSSHSANLAVRDEKESQQTTLIGCKLRAEHCRSLLIFEPAPTLNSPLLYRPGVG